MVRTCEFSYVTHFDGIRFDLLISWKSHGAPVWGYNRYMCLVLMVSSFYVLYCKMCCGPWSWTLCYSQLTDEFIIMYRKLSNQGAADVFGNVFESTYIVILLFNMFMRHCVYVLQALVKDKPNVLFNGETTLCFMNCQG